MDNLNFVAIDLETATRDRASICEIGIAVVQDSVVTERRSWLVKPEYNYYDPRNIEIHGITPEMTKHSPDFESVWHEVLPYLENHLVVAHNTSFDMYAIQDALDRNGLDYPSFDYICSMRLAKRSMRQHKSSLGFLCNVLGIELENHHRAGDDAAACAEVFISACDFSEAATLEELQEKYGIEMGQFSQLYHTHTPLRLGNRSRRASFKMSDIVGDPKKANPTNYLYGKTVCITGTMMLASKEEILQEIADVGGLPRNSVSGKTDILVVGMQDNRIVGATGMSSKQRKALKLRERGADIEIMSEREFLEVAQLPNMLRASQKMVELKLSVAERRAKRQDGWRESSLVEIEIAEEE